MRELLRKWFRSGERDLQGRRLVSGKPSQDRQQVALRAPLKDGRNDQVNQDLNYKGLIAAGTYDAVIIEVIPYITKTGRGVYKATHQLPSGQTLTDYLIPWSPSYRILWMQLGNGSKFDDIPPAPDWLLGKKVQIKINSFEYDKRTYNVVVAITKRPT